MNIFYDKKLIDFQEDRAKGYSTIHTSRKDSLSRVDHSNFSPEDANYIVADKDKENNMNTRLYNSHSVSQVLIQLIES